MSIDPPRYRWNVVSNEIERHPEGRYVEYEDWKIRDLQFWALLEEYKALQDAHAEVTKQNQYFSKVLEKLND